MASQPGQGPGLEPPPARRIEAVGTIQGAAGQGDSSSVFLTSSEDMYSFEALAADLSNQPAMDEAPDRDAGRSDHHGRALAPMTSVLVSDLSPDPFDGTTRPQHLSVEPADRNRTARPAGPVLWRLFPRCIRATTEEVCIAAEVTLNAAPTECKVTVFKEGVKLPVRLDFLNDQQAIGEDSDQPSRHGRGAGSFRAAMQATAAWQRRVGRDNVSHVLRSQRSDSELVLIWVTPGTNPGLMLIEVHTPPSASSSGGNGYTGSSDSAASHGAAASTGALESAWHTPAAAVTASGAAGAAAPVRGVPAAMAAAAGWPQWPPAPGTTAGRSSTPLAGGASAAAAAASGAGGDGSRALLRGAGALSWQAAAATASLNRGRVLGFSAPEPMLASRDDDDMRGRGALRRMCSSGALSVVVVPDAGMEAEVCALLAMQHQQMPLPMTGGGPEGPLEEQEPPPPHLLLQQQQQQQHRFGYRAAVHDGAPAWGASAAGSDPNQVAAPFTVGAAAGGEAGSAAAATAAGSGRPAGGGSLEGDEDKDDAQARERFLWDLGAWLESSIRRAATAAARPLPQATSPAASHRTLSLPFRHLDQSQLHPQRGGSQRERQRALGELRPVSEIEPAEAAFHGSGGEPWDDSMVSEAWVPASHGLVVGSGGGAAAAALVAAAPEAHMPLPRPALELLGFACSRGWAATATHIVLGLMDMGHPMRGINAAVQVAHGWSALHLAAASGSGELVGMTALWRSYWRYGNSEAAQDEWRAMLAAPGPGGLTPLHLAAVLPQPATAALDLLSTLPTETLTTWFGEAACDGCTPAHYAARAGNSHLNDHALLCLATGTAALDLGTAQGLQEVLPYLGELPSELLNLTCSNSVDLQDAASSGNRSGGNRSSGNRSSNNRSSGNRSSGAASGGGCGGGGAVCGAPGGSLVNVEALSTPQPSPNASLAPTYQTASEGSVKAAGGQAAASKGSVLGARSKPFGGDGSSSFNTAALEGARAAAAPPPLPDAAAAPLPPESSSVSSTTDIVAGVISGSGAAGALVSAARAATAPFASSSARAAAPAAAVAARTSSGSRRSFLSRLVMGRFQCLGGGFAVDEQAGARGRGMTDDEAAAAGSGSRAMRGPSSVASVSASSSSGRSVTAASIGTRSLAQSSVSREGCGDVAPPSGRTGQAQCGGSSPTDPWSLVVSTALAQISHVPTPAAAPPQPQRQTNAADATLKPRTGNPAPGTSSNNSSGSGAANDAQRNANNPSSSRQAGWLGSGASSVLHSSLHPANTRVAALGEPHTPGQQQQPTHGSPLPLSRTTDSSAWSSETWSAQKRGWTEPSRVVTGLLERVSPVTSTRGSAGAASPPGESSQQASSASKLLQPVSLGGEMPGPAGADHACSPLAAMTLEQARQAAVHMVAATAAATAARTRSVSASAGTPTVQSKEGEAAAGRALNNSAPPEICDPRVLTEMHGGPPADGSLQQLQLQPLAQRGQVRLRLLQVAQQLQPSCHMPAPLLPPSPPQQQQQGPLHARQLCDVMQEPGGVVPLSKPTTTTEHGPRSSPTVPLNTLASNCVQLPPSGGRELHRQQRGTAGGGEGRGGVSGRSFQEPGAAAEGTVAREGTAHLAACPAAALAQVAGMRTGSGAATDTEAAEVPAEATVAAVEEAGALCGAVRHCGAEVMPVAAGHALTEPSCDASAGDPRRQRRLCRRHICGGVLAAGFGAGAVLAVGNITRLGPLGLAPVLDVNPGHQAPTSPILAAAAAACSWGLLALVWPKAMTWAAHQHRGPSLPARMPTGSVAVATPVLPDATSSTGSNDNNKNNTTGIASNTITNTTTTTDSASSSSSNTAILCQLAGLAVHCVLLAVRLAAGLHLGPALSQPWMPARGVTVALNEAGADAGGAGGLLLVVSGIELLSALLVGLLLQLLFVCRRRGI